MDSEPDSERITSGNSCNTCKTRKKKCDRLIPKCTFCSTKGLSCNYTQPSHRSRLAALQYRRHHVFRLSPDPQPTATPKAATSSLQSNPPSNEFPAVLFLDSNLAAQYHIEIPKPKLPIPDYVRLLIGEVSHRHIIITHYFETIHEWMPIISKKRFHENVNPFNPLSPDYALLVLCMDLILWYPNPVSQNPRTSTYMAAKRYQLELEISGTLSIQSLQASILIALYELGHAIYPSAFLSVATCARYGTAVGVDWRVCSPWRKPFSWVDAEEKNRCWWAVITLDRVTSIGCRERQPIVPDPESHVFVPSDNKTWDEGMNSVPRMYAVATSSIQWHEFGPSGLVAQATKLLSQVLRHVSVEDDLDEEEAILIDNTLKALLKLLETSDNPDQLYVINQQSICNSALAILHETHATKASKTKIGTYFESIHQAHCITACMRDTAIHGAKLVTCIESASPFIPIVLYQVACTKLRLHREKPTAQTSYELEQIKGYLGKCEERWKNAGAFLKILEAREMLVGADKGS